MENNDLRCIRPSHPTRFASSMRFGLLVLSLLCTLIMAASTPAQATHYRYGSLTWRPDPADLTGNTIIFKVSQAFREGFFGTVAVGDVETTDILRFGDGTQAVVNLVVTSVNPSEGSFFGQVEITHTYVIPGAYTAFFTRPNRLSTLQNNADKPWYVKTNVVAGGTNSSPISTLPAVVNLAVGQPMATFTVPGNDPNGNPLTYSLATPADFPVTVAFTNALGLSITPTGVATFNTMGLTVGHLYNAIVKISDGSTTIMVDFLIQIVGPSASPQFIYPLTGPTPPNGSTIQVIAGTPMLFVVQAMDPDALDVVNLQATGVPLGAAFAIPTPANPVQSTFSWTPTAANVGSYLVSFTAQDQVGVQAITSVTIRVILCDPNATASIMPAATSSVFTGGPVTTIYLGYGPQSVSLTALGPYANYSWSPSASLSSSTGGTVIASPTTTTTYTVTNSSDVGCTATASITIKVVDARCGNKNDKVLVCHNGHEICISPNAVDTHLTGPSHSDVLGTCPAARAAAGPAATPGSDVRLEAAPNPVVGRTTVSFSSPEAAAARVQVYNSFGVLVATLYDGPAEAGQRYAVELDGKPLPAGIYYCRLVVNGESKTTQLMVSK